MKKAAGYLIVALNALIVLFFLFRDELSFPPVIQSFGRIHPLFLHIPIGVLLLTVVIVFVARSHCCAHRAYGNCARCRGRL
jgi:hypothetical protein